MNIHDGLIFVLYPALIIHCLAERKAGSQKSNNREAASSSQMISNCNIEGNVASMWSNPIASRNLLYNIEGNVNSLIKIASIKVSLETNHTHDPNPCAFSTHLLLV